MLKRYFNYKTRIIIPAVIVVIALIVRMLLPDYLLRKTNIFLADFSPNYSLHLEDFDLNLWRGAYRFEGVTGKLKANQNQFLKIQSVEVSIAWRELLNGRILTDINIDNLDFLIIKDIEKMNATKDEGKEVKKTLFPVEVASVQVLNSNLTFEEIPSLNNEKRLRLSELNGTITNLTPTDQHSKSHFTLAANLLGSSNFYAEGAMNLLKNPVTWDIDFKMEKFDLTKLNPFLKRNIPLTFTTGELDLYAEAMSNGGVTRGYVKPFFKKLQVIGKQEEFIGVKHFGAEVITALSNTILRDSKTRTVATVLSFDYDGELHLNKGQSLSRALEHGFTRRLNPGIDQKYHLD